MSIVANAADPVVGKAPATKHMIPIVLAVVGLLAFVAIAWSISARGSKASNASSQSQLATPTASPEAIDNLLRSAAKEGPTSAPTAPALTKAPDSSAALQECLLPRAGRPLDVELLRECQERFSEGAIGQREFGAPSSRGSVAKGKSEAQAGQDDAAQKWASRVSAAFSGPTATSRAQGTGDGSDIAFPAATSGVDAQFASLLSKLGGDLPKEAGANPVADLSRILGGITNAGQGVSPRPSLQALADQEGVTLANEKRRQPLKALPASHGRIIFQGSTIPVVLARPIVSDVGGDVVAMVARDVRDATGRCVMIPSGSVALGAYSSQTFDGQDRLAFAFFRIILPDGQSLWMDPMGALDNDGTAGVRADVDRRLLTRFGQAFLSATVAFGFDLASQRLARNEGSNTNISISTASSPASGATRIIENAANAAIARNGAITPRLSLDRGQPLSIAVNRDISVTPQHCKS